MIKRNSHVASPVARPKRLASMLPLLHGLTCAVALGETWTGSRMDYSRQLAINKGVLKMKGVPAKFIDDIARRQGSFGWSLLVPIIWFPLTGFLVFFIIRYTSISRQIFNVDWSKSDLFVPDSIGIFYLTLPIFTWSLSIWALIAVGLRPSRDWSVDKKRIGNAISTLQYFDAQKGASSIQVEPDLANLANLDTADEFLLAYIKQRYNEPRSHAPERRKYAAAFAAQCLLTFGIVYFTHCTYTNIYGTVLQHRSLASSFDIPLSKTDYAVAACTSSSIRSSDTAVYTVAVGGLYENLFSAWAPEGIGGNGDRIARVYGYDNYLTKNGVKVTRTSVEAARYCVHEMHITDPSSQQQLVHILSGK